MAIYELTADRIEALTRTRFADVDVKERDDLQRLLRERIEVVAPDVLVLAEEFGQWSEGKRRIDLLGLDKDARLVVIELKRTDDGGHMELQAVRYAAMVARMTFQQAVDAHTRYLTQRGLDGDAEAAILDFLGWDEADEDEFAQDVRIVLVSADFSKEVSTSVLWLNERGLDVRCVRLRPYTHDGRVLLDVQQVIPLPEAAEYLVEVREKVEKERRSRASQRDLTRFDLTIDGVTRAALPKRTAMLAVVTALAEKGVSPRTMNEVVAWRGNMFRVATGALDAEGFAHRMEEVAAGGGPSWRAKAWYCDDDSLLVADGETWALSKNWGGRSREALELLVRAYPDAGIAIQVAE